MTLREYLQVIRERWIYIAAGLGLGVLVATVLTVTTTRQYTSNAVLYVATQSSGDNTTALYQGSLLSQQRVKSYTEMITSPRITGPAATQIDAPPEIGKAVTATAQPDTVLVTVGVTDSQPERAAAMANAVADVFSRSVTVLEAPVGRPGPPTVSVQVFEPATVPLAPASPRPPLNLALGAMLGLVLGLGAAFARHVVDTRISSVHDVERISGAATLGTIAYDRGFEATPLIFESEPRSPRAEGFRQLRTNLEFVDVERSRKTFVVTSSLPGEGKSTTASNLALALRAAGTSVVLVEADLRRPKVADHFGLERTVGLTSVLTGRVPLDMALQSWGGTPALQVLASGVLPPNPSELLGSRNMEDLLGELGRRFSVVLVDAPPVLPVTDAAALGRLCDGVLFVVRHGQTTRPELGAALDALETASVRVLGTVVNGVPTTGPRRYAQYDRYYGPAAHSTNSQPARDTSSDDARSLQTTPLRTAPLNRRSATRLRPRGEPLQGGTMGSTGDGAAGHPSRDPGGPTTERARAAGSPRRLSRKAL